MENKRFYHISFSGGCGYNEEFIICRTLSEAEEAAYEAAVEDFYRYSGLHGIPSENDIAEEMFGKDYEELTEDEREAVWEEYAEERESWIDYGAREITEQEYINQELDCNDYE